MQTSQKLEQRADVAEAWSGQLMLLLTGQVTGLHFGRLSYRINDLRYSGASCIRVQAVIIAMSVEFPLNLGRIAQVYATPIRNGKQHPSAPKYLLWIKIHEYLYQHKTGSRMAEQIIYCYFYQETFHVRYIDSCAKPHGF